MMPPPRRKKWTEAEERTLIDKYGEMVCDGTLAKMKTRERKYRPIALHVNSMHNVRDPITYPWQWTWKDVSTKVQNMRHQYSLVKQKIKKPDLLVGDSGGEEFDWGEGLTHWCNFLRYKDVFGDISLVYNNSNDAMMVATGNNENDDMGFDGSGPGMEIVQFGHLGHGEDADFPAGIDGGENGVMSLEFEYNGEEEGEENYNHDEDDDANNNNNDSNNIIINDMKEDGDDGFVYEDVDPAGSHTRKKRKVLKEGLEQKAWGFLVNQVGQLREMETRFEQREAERERERQRKEHLRREIEQECERKREEEGERERQEREKARELRRERIRELESMEKESEDRERRRREEELIFEREWEERMNRRRSEWKKRIDNMLSQHQTEMGQIQTRILHEQQNLTSQLLGIVAQWTGHPTGLSDHTGATNHYLSQMMQNLHHMNGIVHEDTRVEGDNQDDQFIVDG